LDHATDAFIEVRATDLTEAFITAANAVIELTLDPKKVEPREERDFIAKGKDLQYLLFSWLEELIFVMITEGFAIRRVEISLETDNEYTIKAKAIGEPLDFQKHNFKVEIKAPTFYDMKIEQNEGVFMRFLLDL